MAKRFTDTELSDKEWFMSLSCRLKCVVRYLFDKCDNAGVWNPNYKLAAVFIGEPFTEEEVLKIDGGEQFEKFGEKIFVKGFIEFQYGELSEKCKPHVPIINKLRKYGLYEKMKGYSKGIDTLKEKEKDEDKEQEKDLGKSENPLKTFPTMPKVSDVGDLPKAKIISTIEILKITAQIDLKEPDVLIMWDAFKQQNLTGKRYYLDEEAVQSHFMNWIKRTDFKKIEKHGNTKTPKNSKNVGAYELLSDLKSDINR